MIVSNYFNRKVFLNKNIRIIFLIIVIAVILKLIILSLIIQHNYLVWDKTMWYEAIVSMNETKLIPYFNDFRWILGVSEYPVGFTYILLLFYPIINLIKKEGFFWLWGLMQICFDVGIVLLLFNMLKNKRRIIIGFLFAPSVLILSTSRFDLIPSFFVLLAIYFLSQDKIFHAGIVSSIAVLLKIYPAALILGLYKKVFNKNFLFALIIIFVLLNCFTLLNFKALLFPFMSNYGFRAESLFGLFGLLGFTFKYANLINKIILVILFLLAFFKSKTNLGRVICIIIAIIITSPVFSPQWNLWLLPLFLLTKIPLIHIILFDLITIIEFPFVWQISYRLTSFDNSLFNPFQPFNFLFVLLNILRYSFLVYFFIISYSDKSLINPNVKNKIRNLLK